MILKQENDTCTVLYQNGPFTFEEAFRECLKGGMALARFRDSSEFQAVSGLVGEGVLLG